ncbi:MAG: hypothetical protein FJ263_00465 [Planctomycetes bacterium]|nr:hypothetical protein [Planctomycetota bacterium]
MQKGKEIMMYHAEIRKYMLFFCVFGCFYLTLVNARQIVIKKENDVSVNAARKLFAAPPTEYSSAPLWVWNDMLTDEQIVSTMNDLARQKVKQVFIHPRPGLMTPYLSDEWFRLWKLALKEAQRLDMNVWIYDENSYPSGFAGGLVPDAMPEARGVGIVTRDHKQPPKASKDTVAVYQLVGDKAVNVTSRIRSNESLLDGDYLEVVMQYAKPSAWLGGKYYVDLLKPGVTEKFLEITMGAYQRQIGEHFGKRVPGVFTDEPHLTPAGGLHWTGDLPEAFQKRWAYSLVDHLPSLFRPVGDFKRVRHDYYQVLLELFIDRWARPCFEYCDQHNLEFTGHYWEHGWPGASSGSDNMAMYAWHQRPAIDVLMNQYNEKTNAQFGNVRIVKELSSVANQLGLKRTLCEAYGAGGWDLRFEDMKRIGDWLYVLGINTMDEHLSYVTIRGARKHDHPQSFSYHEPWWEAYHIMAEYFSRLSAALSQGRELNEIVVIEPTSTAWMYQGMGEELKRIGDSFQQLVTSMSKAQVEYDIGCEDIIARHGRIDRDKFVIGQRQYHTVVISPFTENLNSKTINLLQDYLKNGGIVLCCGQAPARVDGKESQDGARLAGSKRWETVDADALAARLASSGSGGFKIHRSDGDRGILLHQRRHFKDGQLLFLTNTSIESPAKGTIESACRGIEQWDPATGRISPYPFAKVNANLRAEFDLAPCGSLLLFLSNKSNGKNAPVEENVQTLKANGSLTARRIGPNVLTVDYMDVSAGGQTEENSYFYKANQFAFQQNGLQRNPWDNAVQFRDECIHKTFDQGSGLEAQYHFNIEQQLPEKLWIVIERADLYEITCNGRTVAAAKGMWWLDKSFGRIDITETAKLGKNTVRIKASPFTIYHELEPAYILGQFALTQTDSGFTIVGSGSDMNTGSWKQQGCPFYAEGVSYTQTFDIDKSRGKYFVELEKWYGSVAEVKVNSRSAGYIGYRPWRCEVTNLIGPGTNTIEVIVTGTLKNTLGPHHAGDQLGSAWPRMFHKGPENGPPPGQQYHTIDYGLFEPFSLKGLAR